ncbi:hypothetical protein BJX65DRAFT_308012 [Aspergillus insuetus]
MSAPAEAEIIRIFEETISWASFKIRRVVNTSSYRWSQPAILVEKKPEAGRQIVWLIDFLLPEQQSAFFENLSKRSDRDCSIFSWHTDFTKGILEEYDSSFWPLRDLVRTLEKVPMLEAPVIPLIPTTDPIASSQSEPPGIHQAEAFRNNHEIVRHFIHLDSQSELLALLKRAHPLKTRSKELQERLSNEISLVYNLVSQALGRDARSDSSTMKALGVVGLLYLPGTFVSGMFGTNFFSFQGGSSSGPGASSDSPNDDWTVSSHFWLYWAVTVSLTVTTLLAWDLWHSRARWTRALRMAWGMVFEMVSGY